MKYETVRYIPLRAGLELSKLKEQLPAEIVGELVEDERLTRVNVKSHKIDVIEYLDKAFGIGQRDDFVKTTCLEVTKDEIDNYEYFTIQPRVLQFGGDVFCTISRPTCASESCPVGAKLIPPVRIKAKKSKKIGLAEINRPWGNKRELIVSSEVKRLFEELGIRGLTYEQCVLENEGVVDSGATAPAYMATIAGHVGQYADRMIATSYYCEEHRMPSYFHLVNEKTLRADMADDDFQVIDNVIADGEVYRYYKPRLVITKRVLKILLKKRIKGLGPMTFFLNEEFRPVIVS